MAECEGMLANARQQERAAAADRAAAAAERAGAARAAAAALKGAGARRSLPGNALKARLPTCRPVSCCQGSCGCCALRLWCASRRRRVCFAAGVAAAASCAAEGCSQSALCRRRVRDLQQLAQPHRRVCRELRARRAWRSCWTARWAGGRPPTRARARAPQRRWPSRRWCPAGRCAASPRTTAAASRWLLTGARAAAAPAGGRSRAPVPAVRNRRGCRPSHGSHGLATPLDGLFDRCYHAACPR